VKEKKENIFTRAEIIKEKTIKGKVKNNNIFIWNSKKADLLQACQTTIKSNSYNL
jgi:hypothetical protein